MSKLDKYSTEILYAAMEEARRSGQDDKANKLALAIEKRTGGIVGEVKEGQQIKPEPSDKKEMPPMEYGRAIVESGARGLTLGLTDYPPAIGAGVESAIKGDGFAKGYQQQRQETVARRKKLSDIDPSASLLYETVPAMATGFGVARELAKRGATLGQQVATGAGEGSLTGLLTTYGDPYDKAVMAGIGGVTGAMGYGVGAGFPRVTQQAKDVMEKGVPLTVGQQRGAVPEFLEKTIESSLLDIPVGVSKSKLKGFEGFNRMIIEDAVKPLGITFKKDLAPEEIFTKAVRKTRDKFEEAVNKVTLTSTNPMVLRRKALEDPVNQQLLMDKFSLTPKDVPQYIKVIDDLFYSKILPKGKGTTAAEIFSKDVSVGEKQITGKRLSNAISQLNDASQEAFDDKNSALSSAIKAFRSEVIDEIQKRVKNSDDFIKSRKAWANMSAIKDASRGREIITPVDYEKALFRKYGDTFRESAEYKKIKPIKDIIGEGGAKVSQEGQDRLVGLQTVQGAQSTFGGIGNVGLAAAGGTAVGTGSAGLLLPVIGTTAGLAGGYRTKLGKEALGLLYGGAGRGAESVGIGVPMFITNE